MWADTVRDATEFYKQQPHSFFINPADGSMMYYLTSGKRPPALREFAAQKLAPGIYLFDPRDSATIRGESYP